MNTYEEAKEMLKRELDSIVKKGELSAGSLETVDKLLNSIKNACKITMYDEYSEDGYSNTDYSMNDYSNARGRQRDSMGRYSGTKGGYSSRNNRYSYGSGENEEKVEMLREMMNEVTSEEERRTLNKLIRHFEQ